MYEGRAMVSGLRQYEHLTAPQVSGDASALRSKASSGGRAGEWGY